MLKVLYKIDVNMDIRIEKLTYNTLAKTIAAAEEVFPHVLFSLADDFESSLNDEKLKKFNEEFCSADNLYFPHEFLWQEYWIALTETDEVAGFVGLHMIEEDKNDSLWVSCFGVREKFRRFGLGGRLIDFVIQEARKKEAKNLRLYTTTHDLEKAAQVFYEKKGFKEMTNRDRVKYLGVEVLFRELKL